MDILGVIWGFFILLNWILISQCWNLLKSDELVTFILLSFVPLANIITLIPMGITLLWEPVVNKKNKENVIPKNKNILCLKTGVIMNIKRKKFEKLREHKVVKWSDKYKYYTIGSYEYL